MLRTFFFVIFGLTVSLSGLFTLKVVLVSVSVIIVTYILRYILLRIFKKEGVDPLLYITPRGLITVLLFFSIPVTNSINPDYAQNPDFDSGILLFTIIGTSLIMTSALIKRGRNLALGDPIPDMGDELEGYEQAYEKDALDEGDNGSE